MDRVFNWFRQQFSNPQIVFLALVVLGLGLIVSFAGNMMAPAIASVVLAYLLEGVISRMGRLGLPRFISVWLVFLFFLLFLAGITFGLLPIIYNQLTGLVQQLPNMLTKGQALLMALPERYPDLISNEQVRELISSLRQQLTDYGQMLVTSTLSSAASIVTLLIYVVLVPFMIFFFLMDKRTILNWLRDFLPRDNELAIRVWADVDAQIANYLRGKFWEILIVWGVTFAAFSFLGLEFAMLMAFIVGVSVIIPYVGAAVVTIPVVMVAWFQWGWSSEFITLVVTYLVIQILDGNLLVPLLFAGVVNIHPVAIILAVLFFGGLWGLWGVIFAIPLATLVQAIILAWPKPTRAGDGA